jgi:hypothetical protein
MTIREQLELLLRLGVDLVVVGGQAGVLRQAIEFSQDLDILVRPTPENAVRLQPAIREIAAADVDPGALYTREFQQFVHPADGTEIDVHLKILGLPDFDAALRNSSTVDFLGLATTCLELPALYASKRTDRTRDAAHRLAIEARLRHLLTNGTIAGDEIVLACCLDESVAGLPGVSGTLPSLARATKQPLLQARLAALADATLEESLRGNPSLHPRVAALLDLDPAVRDKLLGNPNRFGTLLATFELTLPGEGYRVHPPR